ncbi:MAG: alpha/beta fold hydrolase [Rhodocyclaceae bacterium]|nr:alpha/beta fold hydrolase [Rhodocyclaceae bacterium]
MTQPVDSPLYPAVEPESETWLEVTGGHRIYVQQSGNLQGHPLLLLHGGPGSAATAMQRRFFDPARYRIVQFDQRGCGRSEPSGALRHNHAAALLDDIEALRRHLGIERWRVSGGSWGATLAVCYAARSRAHVDSLLLRALFLGGASDLGWFFGGAGSLLPEAWQAFLQVVPRQRRRQLQAWLWRVFAGDDEDLQVRVSGAWRNWERALQGEPPMSEPVGQADVCRYRIQAHYLSRRCFLGERRVLGDIARLHGLPVIWLHGRQDLVCRPANSWRAWRTLSGSRLVWVDGAGHDPFAPSMVAAIRRHADAWLDELVPPA